MDYFQVPTWCKILQEGIFYILQNKLKSDTLEVWPEKSRQMSIKVDQKGFQ